MHMQLFGNRIRSFNCKNRSLTLAKAYLRLEAYLLFFGVGSFAVFGLVFSGAVGTVTGLAFTGLTVLSGLNLAICSCLGVDSDFSSLDGVAIGFLGGLDDFVGA